MQNGFARAGRFVAAMALLAAGLSCSDNGVIIPDLTPALHDAAASVTASSGSAVVFVAASAGSSNNGSTLTLDRPAGLAAGDVMVAQLATHGSVRVNTLAGWTLIREDHNGADANSYVYWRRADADEPSSYAWKISSGSQVAGGIVAYRNVAASGDPVEAHAAQWTASGVDIVAPSVMIASADALLITVFASAGVRKETGLSFTPPAGMVERYDAGSDATNGNSRNPVAMHATTQLTQSGSTGSRSARLSAARPGWGQTVVLRPAGPPEPPPVNTPPVARAGGPYSATEGAAITFDGSTSSDADGDALTYSWSLGDGRTVTGVKPTASYPDNGTFTVVLTVSDPHGGSSADTTTATITNAAPAVSLTVAASATVGQTITATGSFTDAGSADAPWTWQLNWGDGTTQSGTTSNPATPITASRAYAAAGNYTVQLSVTDKDGGTGSAQKPVSVTAGGQQDVWYTDFSEHPTGQAPTGWSQPYTVSSWTVVARAGTTGGKVLSHTTPVTAFYALRWDAVGTAADVDIETVARVATGGTYNESLALIARGAAGAHTFYASRLDSGTGRWTLVRYDNGVSTVLATRSNSFAAGTWVRHRFRVEGNTIRMKVWAADSPEPADWRLEAVDASPLGAGFAGVFMRRGAAVNEFDWVRVTRLSGGGPVDPPPTDPSVSWVWSGAQTPVGAMVRTQLSGSSTSVRLRISTDSLFGTYTETPAAATAGNNVATFVITGRAPDTRYFYRVVSGSIVDAAKQGAFRTLPIAGSPHSFTFALGSCQRTDTNKSVFNHIRDTNALFWLQTGDIHYRNIATNSIDLFRTAYNSLHNQSNQAAMFRALPIVHVWDDHDGAGGNDTDGTKTGWPAARAAYRENVPHHALPAGPTGAIYHSFVVGRVRFIVTDVRSERSPPSQLDNSSKTMLGAAQKQYLKDEMAAAKANGQFIAWVSTIPWIAARTTGADHWGGYDTERQEIAAYIASLGVGGQMFVLSGDMHATAIDSGANNAWGGFPVFNAAPVDQSSSTKGGPYTHGPFTNGTLGEQFGVVTVTDNGGSTIQVTFTGRRNGSAIAGASHQFTRTLAPN